jgi:hypothetical protein
VTDRDALILVAVALVIWVALLVAVARRKT